MPAVRGQVVTPRISLAQLLLCTAAFRGEQGLFLRQEPCGTWGTERPPSACRSRPSWCVFHVLGEAVP